MDPRRLLRTDMVPIGSGVYVPHDLARGEDDGGLYRFRALGLAAEYDEGWLSHTTAARLRGWPLSSQLRRDGTVHVSFAAEAGQRARRRGMVSHRCAVRAEDVMNLHGVRFSSMPRTWFELGSLATVEDMVVLGDHLLRMPYPKYEQRVAPFCTPQQLREVVTSSSGQPGRVTAMDALDLVRCGADSAAETRLRLALIRAGLPEPALQVPAQPELFGSPSADLGYPHHRLAIQYEGGSHFTAERARADLARDNIFLAAGWTLLKFHVWDYREGFVSAVRQVATILARRR